VTRVEEILAERRARLGRGRQAVSFAAAAALHVAFVALLVVAPAIRAEREAPLEFVAVEVVPAARLGIERPAPPPPRPEPPPEPEPAPTVPEPEPAPPEEPPMPPTEPEEPAPVAKPRPQPPPAAPAAAPAPGPAGRQGSPQGQPLGTSSFGSDAVGLDNPDFTYGYYIDQMLALIRAQWVRPPLGGGVEALVHFRILRDGRIDDIRIVRSSGYSSFDLAGMRALQAASPLPPLPRSYRQGTLGVNLIIR
jgi:TonB family protein